MSETAGLLSSIVASLPVVVKEKKPRKPAVKKIVGEECSIVVPEPDEIPIVVPRSGTGAVVPRKKSMPAAQIRTIQLKYANLKNELSTFHQILGDLLRTTNDEE